MGTTYLALQEKVTWLAEYTHQEAKGWRQGEYNARPEMYKPFKGGTTCSLEQLAHYFDSHPWAAPPKYREKFNPTWRESDPR